MMREKDAEAAEPGEKEIFKPRLELGSLVICHFAAVNRNVGAIIIAGRIGQSQRRVFKGRMICDSFYPAPFGREKGEGQNVKGSAPYPRFLREDEDGFRFRCPHLNPLPEREEVRGADR